MLDERRFPGAICADEAVHRAGRQGEVHRIERELGQGGMATVYLAADLKHDRKVAIKVLKPELAAVLGHSGYHAPGAVPSVLRARALDALCELSLLSAALPGGPKVSIKELEPES